jgi:very-long-chain (3R)-3-hydroxyacyl-CoA dehydratase
MFFSSMVVAWSVTEIIRYTFYALTLLIGTAPYISLWTRYTFFFVLYPLGAGSEWMLVQEAKKVTTNPILYWCLLAMQLIYVPGFAFMYTHMIKQRKKCLGAPDSDKKRK